MARGGKRPGAGRKKALDFDKPPAKPAIGRPSSYKPEYAAQAAKLCELGATDQDLAEFFEVSRVTIYRWQCEHAEFCSALKVGKGAADDRVERSLYQRAVGYSHDAVKIFPNNRTGENMIVPYTEHYPPDVTAAIFWLKNRRRAEWRDKLEKDPDNDGFEKSVASDAPVLAPDERTPDKPIL